MSSSTSAGLEQGDAPHAITIRKHNFRGDYVFEWSGQVISRSVDTLVVLAAWTRSPHQEGRMVFEPGDLFLEYYYATHPFSIWQVHGPSSSINPAVNMLGPLKGWYCNVCEPMSLQGDPLWFRDLILDLLVYPDGSHDLRDHDEFIAARTAGLSDKLAAVADGAITELYCWINQQREPFSVLSAPC